MSFVRYEVQKKVAFEMKKKIIIKKMNNKLNIVSIIIDSVN